MGLSERGGYTTLLPEWCFAEGFVQHPRGFGKRQELCQKQMEPYKFLLKPVINKR